LKEQVREFLAKLSCSILDLGAYNSEPSDYPDFAVAVGESLMSSTADRGILICGSGVGVCVAANKMPGIRAAICHDTYSGHQGVEHDDMNVLVLGSRVVGSALALELASAFLAASFTHEARHVRRLQKVLILESKLHSPTTATLHE
jgi:ribose 5-phosphate isomerase B